MPTFANIAGIVCILFLMFFFPIMHGVARLICYLAMSTERAPQPMKGNNYNA